MSQDENTEVMGATLIAEALKSQVRGVSRTTHTTHHVGVRTVSGARCFPSPLASLHPRVSFPPIGRRVRVRGSGVSDHRARHRDPEGPRHVSVPPARQPPAYP